jgi:hypothetical protein
MSRENTRPEKQNVSSEEEILHLKRLLVTIKQKYEQTLQQFNQQLQIEVAEKNKLQKEFENNQKEILELKKQHEEEHDALIHQQLILKDLLTTAKKEANEKLHAWQESLSTQNNTNSLSESPSPSSPILLKKIEILEERLKEQSQLQDKYEEAKEELSFLSVKFDEALEGRLNAEKTAKDHENTIALIKIQLNDKEKEIIALKESFQNTHNSFQEKNLLIEDLDSRLKIAQQHLAKKVKESALLSNELNHLELRLTESERSSQDTEFHINRMESEIESLHKNEKKLQESLNEALKNNEIQVAKWEEKYFQMYDKLQAIEIKNQELMKVQERHLRMQALLNNFGSLMHTPLAESEVLPNPNEENLNTFRPPYSPDNL